MYEKFLPSNLGERNSALNRGGVAAFRRDGALLAVAHTPHLVQLLNPHAGDTLATLTSPNRLLIRDLAFSPDGNQLAVASENAVLQLWDLTVLRRDLARLGLDWRDDTHPPHRIPFTLRDSRGR